MARKRAQTMLTAAQVAEQLGITSSRVRQLARARGLGVQVNPRLWLFSAADIDGMRTRIAGRPRAAPPAADLEDR